MIILYSITIFSTIFYVYAGFFAFYYFNITEWYTVPPFQLSLL